MLFRSWGAARDIRAARRVGQALPLRSGAARDIRAARRVGRALPLRSGRLQAIGRAFSAGLLCRFALPGFTTTRAVRESPLVQGTFRMQKRGIARRSIPSAADIFKSRGKKPQIRMEKRGIARKGVPHGGYSSDREGKNCGPQRRRLAVRRHGVRHYGGMPPWFPGFRTEEDGLDFS